MLGGIIYITKSVINRKGRMASLRYLIPALLIGGFSLLALNSQVVDLKDSVSQVKGDLRGGLVVISVFIDWGGARRSDQASPILISPGQVVLLAKPANRLA